MKILVGNSFPLALIERRVRIAPRTREALRQACQGREILSFWGHANSLRAAGDWLGLDLTPRSPRPALTVNREGWPVLHGVVFRECWVLAACLAVPGRPNPSGELATREIAAWQVLQMIWL